MVRFFLSALVLVSALWQSAFAQCSDGRYYDNIFNVKLTQNIQYGGNFRFNGDYQNLYLNIYEPENDTFPTRPLILLAFGGSFTFGSKTSPDIVKLCNEFAKKGYVTTAIDYRLGFENNNDSDTNQFKALMRAAQDMRASIRFFYKDASTDNKYRIDTNQIFIGGVSAGGFTALNLAYGKADTLSRVRPPYVDQALAEVGGIDGNSGNPGYSNNVKGVINLAGAIGDTVWLMPTDPVLCGVHGLNDNLVPCYFDSAKAANSVEALMFGSGDLITRATNVGLPHSIYLFKGAGHVPFVFNQAYMDTTIWTIRDFLVQHVVCVTEVSSVREVAGERRFNVYPNPFHGGFTIEKSPGFSDDYTVQLTDLAGRLMDVKMENDAGDVKKISLKEHATGFYLLKLISSSGSTVFAQKIFAF